MNLQAAWSQSKLLYAAAGSDRAATTPSTHWAGLCANKVLLTKTIVAALKFVDNLKVVQKRITVKFKILESPNFMENLSKISDFHI